MINPILQFGMSQETVILLSSLLLSAIAIFNKNLFISAFMFAFVSSITGLLYALIHAPDVAITEASIGVLATSFIIFIMIIRTTKTKPNKIQEYTEYKIPIIQVVYFIIFALISGFIYSKISSGITHHPLKEYYLTQTQAEIGISSVVAAILTSYRGFDTFGELIVIFTSSITIIALIGDKFLVGSHNQSRHSFLVNDTQKYDTVLHFGSKFLIPFSLIFSFYLLITGNDRPGGAFQAGAVLASTIMFYFLSTPYSELTRALSINILKKINLSGLIIFLITGITSLAYGGKFLDHNFLAATHQIDLGIFLFIVELAIYITVSSSLLISMYLFVHE